MGDPRLELIGRRDGWQKNGREGLQIVQTYGGGRTPQMGGPTGSSSSSGGHSGKGNGLGATGSSGRNPLRRSGKVVAEQIGRFEPGQRVYSIVMVVVMTVAVIGFAQTSCSAAVVVGTQQTGVAGGGQY